MCGIVGVVGNENATEILISGLEKLEYRGYDSAGIYVNDLKQGHLVKEVGKIENLKRAIGPEVKGSTGIGHTRWATHGQPTIENAHPQVSSDARFNLVHNGVITNYQEIKKDYLNDVNFVGDTDTEVAVNLISKFANDGLPTKEAFAKALKIIKGSYAFVLLDSQKPEEIFVAKNKSPLLIGVGNGNGNFVCSDAMAMIHQTNKFIEINDLEMVEVFSNDILISDFDGNEVKRKPYQVNFDATDIDKGGYPHFMLKEIDEQPGVMRRIAKAYFDDNGEISVNEELINDISDADTIYIVAAGTSYHAGLIGKNLFEELTNIPVQVHVASEFAYHIPILSKKPFFIFLSQSGETADSRQVLVNVNKAGYPSLTITNSESSTLSREATHTLLLHAGPEIAVASTKAYTAQIAVEAILAKMVGEHLNIAKAKDFDVKHELGLVATAIDEVVAEKDKIKELANEFLTNQKSAFYIGRGNDYNVSLEAALKLKEISYIQAEGFAGGELKHGTIALIEEGTPVIAIITDVVGDEHTRGNIREVQARGAKVLTISSDQVARPEDSFVISEVNPLLTSLVSVVVPQLIAYYATLNLGNDVDQPRNLAKSVTVE